MVLRRGCELLPAADSPAPDTRPPLAIRSGERVGGYTTIGRQIRQVAVSVTPLDGEEASPGSGEVVLPGWRLQGSQLPFTLEPDVHDELDGAFARYRR